MQASQPRRGVQRDTWRRVRAFAAPHRRTIVAFLVLATTSATSGGPSTETIDWVASAIWLIIPAFWTPMRMLSAVVYAKVERSSALR